MIDYKLILDGINEVLTMIKRHQYNEAQAKIANELNQSFHKEITERRKKLDEINKSIFQLDVGIKKVDVQYSTIKKECPDVLLSSIEKYIKQLKKEKTMLEIKKRSIARDI
ncbi:hypothetical protein P5G62_010980 [Neobacillus sp. 179-C4.2 HS]|uniref:Uncharacterized protein n=1 Tax=Neobacillus driksii TaxID=3035913 RepID=A0ABV4YSB7_9BACI|nr:hypothetical protein [Neobacillus sp. 179.-C4.2 HS]MDP5194249.1 hypothetical protein [Neobacillus sp. 179.-C4.2 HS]